MGRNPECSKQQQPNSSKHELEANGMERIQTTIDALIYHLEQALVSPQDIAKIVITTLNTIAPHLKPESSATAPFDVLIPLSNGSKFTVYLDHESRNFEPDNPIPKVNNLQYDSGQSYSAEDLE
ncbi:MAG: hypothetical protein WDZ94_02345 [Patescibacteria group bacterium]